MALTYDCISTFTANGENTISFTSIPSTYTDLKLVFVGSTGGGICQVQYNGLATNYTCMIMDGSSDSANARTYSVGWIYVIPPSTTTEIISQQINIQNYANTNVHKTSISRADISSGSTTESVQLWRSNTAINRVDLITSGAGVFIGTCSIYGIKAA